jgi:hypothetical protein
MGYSTARALKVFPTSLPELNSFLNVLSVSPSEPFHLHYNNVDGILEKETMKMIMMSTVLIPSQYIGLS